MRTRKTMILLLALLVFCCALVAGCTPGGTEEPTTTPSETTLPTNPTLPPETTIPETTAPDQTAKLLAQLEAQGYESLDRLLVRSDVQVAVEGENIVLSENGLELELSTQSTQVLRNGYIVAALQKQPQIVAGEVYVHQDSFDRLFLGDHPAVSLFRGISFFPEEIRTALTDPDGSDFNRKLLDEVLLPTSMGIQTPHVDVTRVFWDWALNEDTWEQAQKFQEYVDGLSKEEQDFAREKKIELRDLEYLSRVFYGEHMKQSDKMLKDTLELCYAASFCQDGTRLTNEQTVQVMDGIYNIVNFFAKYFPVPEQFYMRTFLRRFPDTLRIDCGEFEGAWNDREIADAEAAIIELRGQDYFENVRIYRSDAAAVDARIQKYLGISLKDIPDWNELTDFDGNLWSWALYLEEYDAFYAADSSSEGGAWLGDCVDGYFYDNFFGKGVVLFFQWNDKGSFVVLTEQDDRYVIKAYLPII